MTPPVQAMALVTPAAGALVPLSPPVPEPGPQQLRVAVHACGICRTDLHIVDGELPPRPLPITPGHEIVGHVDAVGAEAAGFEIGDRVGVPWLGQTCGVCTYCSSGRENLCRAAQFTGYDLPGGFANHVVADARYCLRIPAGYDDQHAAPLLCAGLIGFRAYRMAGAGTRLGLYGFGAAAHIIAQVARHDGREVFAFTREGDLEAAALARRLGARWAGSSTEPPPTPLDAAIIFAPVGPLVPEALSRLAPGGTVVSAGIHMTDIPAFPYARLWDERVIRSVANLTRDDGRLFMSVAARVPIQTEVRPYALTDINRALADLREGRLAGAAVAVPLR